MEEKLNEVCEILKKSFDAMSKILKSIDLDDVYGSMNNEFRTTMKSKISFIEKNIKDLQTLCLYYGIVLKLDNRDEDDYEKYTSMITELVKTFKTVVFLIKSKRTSEEEFEFIYDCLDSKTLLKVGLKFESFFDSEETIEYLRNRRFITVDYYISIDNFINSFENLSRRESRERLMKFYNFVIDHEDEIKNEPSMIFFDFDDEDDRSVSSEVTEEG